MGLSFVVATFTTGFKFYWIYFVVRVRIGLLETFFSMFCFYLKSSLLVCSSQVVSPWSCAFPPPYTSVACYLVLVIWCLLWCGEGSERLEELSVFLLQPQAQPNPVSLVSGMEFSQ